MTIDPNKVLMQAEDLAVIVYDRFAELAKEANDAGVPLNLLLGELMKLAIKMAVHLEGKQAAKRNLRSFMDRYFAGLTSEDERRIRSGGEPASARPN